MEAFVEALLLIDLAQYDLDEGRELLEDLQDKFVELTTERRREHETLLGLRRGAGPIARIAHPEATVLHRPGLRGGPWLEDSVLNQLQPDVDPRVVELVNDLPPQDRKIAMMKIATGCAWAAAAAECNAPASRGEAVRRRLHRHRDALTPCVDPWSAAQATTPPAELSAFGRVRPAPVRIDRATGIWP